MSGYLRKGLEKNVREALEEVNAYEWEGDYRFETRNKLKELLEDRMGTEVEQHLGRQLYERREAGDTEDYRNGGRVRHFLTELGDLMVRIPRTRKGFITKVLEAYQRRSRKGPWALSNRKPIKVAMPNQFFAEQGLLGLFQQHDAVR